MGIRLRRGDSTGTNPPGNGSLDEPNWHTLSVDEVFDRLETSSQGLAADQAEARQVRYGRNVIPDRPGPGVISLVVRQFRNPLIYVLLIAGAVALAVQEVVDAIFIFGVLIINAAVGAFQEWQAEHGARALQSVVRVKATVRRGATLEELDASELVPGDVVLLESGGAVPADLRIIGAIETTVDESVLTGESEPVAKDPAAIELAESPVGDRFNMLYAGTSMVRGRATAIVASTGSITQIGRIARSLTEQSAPPPLVARMRSFTTRLTLALMVLIVALGAAQFIRGSDVGDVVLLMIALAVSAIPEGLPVGVTVALSIASRRMAGRNVIVRLLPAVEGLGACTVIATDKTGTLTVNRMTVKRLVLADGFEAEVAGEGLELSGEMLHEGQVLAGGRLDELARIAKSGVLCNEAQLRLVEDEVVAVGDTVDAAFLVLGEKLGLSKVEVEDAASRVGLIPYESARGFAASYNRSGGFGGSGGEVTCSVKGAVELVLEMCEGVDRPTVLDWTQQLASSGFRVIALAAGPAEMPDPSLIPSQIPTRPSGLRFLGLAGLIDPVRRDVPDAIQRCRDAGVDVKMVTGDHPATALAIARQLGIATDESEVVHGRELSVGEVESDRIEAASVFARVEPSQKTGIVTTLQAAGHFIAVTGDGVNDAPALRAANIGVAMGRSGTDVARDASDLIIADDNFASIVNGIEEGRTAYDNVRKIVWLLLATAVGELVLFLLSTAMGLPIPLTPVQLLWLNVVTQGIQDVALAFERKEPGVLRRPPRSPAEEILDRRMIEQVLMSGFVMGLGSFLVFYWLVEVSGWSHFSASNVLLLALVLFENVHVFNSRSELRSVFRVPLAANPFVVASVFLAQGLHLGAMYTPGLRSVLDIEPVNIGTWLTMLGISLSILVTAEVYKRYRRFGAPTGNGRDAKQPA